MQRRQFLTSATATITATSLAGCSGILGGGGGGGSGPDDAAEAYIEAAAEGDSETFETYTHPEGRVTGGTASGTPADASVSVESSEVLEQSEGEATVEVVVGATQGDLSNTVTYEFDVREHEGEWKVYDFTISG